MENLIEYGRSLDLANQINELKRIALSMDLEYIKTAGNKMIEQGDWQDSAAILNPSNPLEANDLLRVQGKALLKLGEFVELLKQCETGKEAVRKAQQSRDDIMKMFL